MNKSREHSQRRAMSLDGEKKGYSASLNLNNMCKSTFITKFEGKIHVVTRAGGLIGALMKTIKPSTRYNVETVNRNSRVKTEAYQSACTKNYLMPTGYSHERNNKENISNYNNIESTKSEETALCAQKLQQKSITPFHLPKLAKIKDSKSFKQVKKNKNPLLLQLPQTLEVPSKRSSLQGISRNLR